MIEIYTLQEQGAKKIIQELLAKQDTGYTDIWRHIWRVGDRFIGLRADRVLLKMKREGLIRHIGKVWTLVKNPPKICPHCKGTGYCKAEADKA
jgi:hypothetical protein